MKYNQLLIKNKIVFILCIFIALTFLDLLTTFIGVTNFGIGGELNPIAVKTFENYGWFGMFALKVFQIVIMGFILSLFFFEALKYNNYSKVYRKLQMAAHTTYIFAGFIVFMNSFSLIILFGNVWGVL